MYLYIIILYYIIYIFTPRIVKGGITDQNCISTRTRQGSENTSIKPGMARPWPAKSNLCPLVIAPAMGGQLMAKGVRALGAGATGVYRGHSGMPCCEMSWEVHGRHFFPDTDGESCQRCRSKTYQDFVTFGIIWHHTRTTFEMIDWYRRNRLYLQLWKCLITKRVACRYPLVN